MIALCALLTGCGSVGSRHTGRAGGTGQPGGLVPEAKSPGAGAPFRFFSSSSVWNETLAADAPLDPNSSAYIAAFDETITAEEQAQTGPWINTTSYSIPVYTVPASQPTVPVTLVDHLEAPALTSAWSAVPLPANAKPARGSDGILAVWQPSTNQLWEFWRLSHEGGSWHAQWGAAMQNVTSNPGVYSSEAWPGAQTYWGASASSMSLLGGLITIEDLEKSKINHALEMAIPARRAHIYTPPAQRTDGKSTNPLSLPEGAHLRLNPNLNLTSLHLPKIILEIAEAAQRYGIYITDGSSTATIDAQDPLPTGTNPYTGTKGLFENKPPNKLLETFPWNQLQLIKLEPHIGRDHGPGRPDA